MLPFGEISQMGRFKNLDGNEFYGENRQTKNQKYKNTAEATGVFSNIHVFYPAYLYDNCESVR
jgi:hypothetical protein